MYLISFDSKSVAIETIKISNSIQVMSQYSTGAFFTAAYAEDFDYFVYGISQEFEFSDDKRVF